jgi:competence ComEA-like helix-hairpin-helix protein
LKKILIVTMLIITLCTSLLLFLHSRDTTKVNINTSSVQALESLPGIGNVLAGRIIQGRPYMDVYELDRVKGIGPKTIEKIIDKVVVK